MRAAQYVRMSTEHQQHSIRRARIICSVELGVAPCSSWSWFIDLPALTRDDRADSLSSRVRSMRLARLRQRSSVFPHHLLSGSLLRPKRPPSPLRHAAHI